MTVAQRDVIKRNWLTFANIIVLVGVIWQQAKWQQEVDGRLNVLEDFSRNTTVHMPFEKKIEVFVPRIELDARLRSIENSLNEIKQSLKAR